MTQDFTKREIELIRILSERKGYVRTEDLCSRMEIKPRTLRECIRSFRDLHAEESGVEIQAGAGLGYQMIIKDKDKYYAFLKKMLEYQTGSQYLIPVDQDDRIDYILRSFLTSSDYIKAEELSEKMYIARSTFAEDLKKARRYLEEYGLTLRSYLGKGMRVEGKEKDIRKAILHLFFKNIEFDEKQMEVGLKTFFSREEYKMIRMLLYQTIRKYSFQMSDASFRNLIMHILIAIQRIKDHTLIEDKTDNSELMQKKEWTIAADICRQLSEKIDMEIPESEIGYITMHLLGKKMISDEKDLIVHPETLNLLTDVLKTIQDRYGYDFSGDIELYSALAMHLQPLLERAKYGLKIENPLLDKIVRENRLAFEMAVAVSEVIHDKTGLRIDADEAGYIAIHFSLAIERLKIPAKKRILVICASGAGTSRMLAYRLKKKFYENIETIDTMSYFDLRANPEVAYDVIFSTVPIYFSVHVPVIRISEFPDDEEFSMIAEELKKDLALFQEICSFFHPSLFFDDADLNSREEIVSFLSEQMKQYISLPDTFPEMILKRESMASTSLGNLVAFPHPNYLVTEKTLTAVLKCRKPILWDGKDVQLVFMTTMQRTDSPAFQVYSQVMTDLVTNRKWIKRILADPSYACVCDCIREIYDQKEEEEDLFR